MSSNLMQYEYLGQGVRILEEDGEALFVASDVARVLCHRDAANMLRSLPADTKGTHVVSTPGGEQRLTVITEPGFFRAVMMRETGRMADQGTRDAVRAFQRWVTHEVLPQIRKTGAYSVNQAPARELMGAELVARALVEANSMLEAKDKELAAASAQIESERPMVAKAIAHSANGKKLVTRSEFAREVISYCADLEPTVPVTFQEAFAFLSEIKLFTKPGTGRSDSGHATTWAIREQYARTEKGITSTGYPFATGKLTRAGQDFAWRRLTQRIANSGSLALSSGSRAA